MTEGEGSKIDRLRAHILAKEAAKKKAEPPAPVDVPAVAAEPTEEQVPTEEIKIDRETSAEATGGGYGVKSAGHTREKEPDEEEKGRINQDAYLNDRAHGLFAVFDSMGGHAAGDIASSMARNAMQGWGMELSEKNADGTRKSAEKIRDELIEQLQTLNTKIYESGIATNQHGMGTTASIVRLWKGEQGERRAVIGNVGDSRVYRYSAQGTLELITEDHSWVNGQLSTYDPSLLKDVNDALDAVDRPVDEMGLEQKLNGAVLLGFSNRNIITQHLGMRKPIDVRAYIVDLEPGDKMVITSDGVHDNLTREQIREIVSQRDVSADAMSKEMVVSANGVSESLSIRAKEDDITAVCIDVLPVEVAKEPPPASPPTADLLAQEEVDALLGLVLDEIKPSGAKVEKEPSPAEEKAPVAKTDLGFEGEEPGRPARPVVEVPKKDTALPPAETLEQKRARVRELMKEAERGGYFTFVDKDKVDAWIADVDTEAFVAEENRKFIFAAIIRELGFDRVRLGGINFTHVGEDGCDVDDRDRPFYRITLNISDASWKEQLIKRLRQVKAHIEAERASAPPPPRVPRGDVRPPPPPAPRGGEAPPYRETPEYHPPEGKDLKTFTAELKAKKDRLIAHLKKTAGKIGTITYLIRNRKAGELTGFIDEVTRRVDWIDGYKQDFYNNRKDPAIATRLDDDFTHALQEEYQLVKEFERFVGELESTRNLDDIKALLDGGRRSRELWRRFHQVDVYLHNIARGYADPRPGWATPAEAEEALPEIPPEFKTGPAIWHDRASGEDWEINVISYWGMSKGVHFVTAEGTSGPVLGRKGEIPLDEIEYEIGRVGVGGRRGDEISPSEAHRPVEIHERITWDGLKFLENGNEVIIEQDGERVEVEFEKSIVDMSFFRYYEDGEQKKKPRTRTIRKGDIESRAVVIYRVVGEKSKVGGEVKREGKAHKEEPPKEEKKKEGKDIASAKKKLVEALVARAEVEQRAIGGLPGSFVGEGKLGNIAWGKERIQNAASVEGIYEKAWGEYEEALEKEIASSQKRAEVIAQLLNKQLDSLNESVAKHYKYNEAGPLRQFWAWRIGKIVPAGRVVVMGGLIGSAHLIESCIGTTGVPQIASDVISSFALWAGSRISIDALEATVRSFTLGNPILSGTQGVIGGHIEKAAAKLVQWGKVVKKVVGKGDLPVRALEAVEKFGGWLKPSAEPQEKDIEKSIEEIQEHLASLEAYAALNGIEDIVRESGVYKRLLKERENKIVALLNQGSVDDDGEVEDARVRLNEADLNTCMLELADLQKQYADLLVGRIGRKEMAFRAMKRWGSVAGGAVVATLSGPFSEFFSKYLIPIALAKPAKQLLNRPARFVKRAAGLS